ncbi:MAG: cysteine desulfurase, partial [Candidatus Gallimonas sp.]
MIYLDNAATGGFKPASVQNAVLAAMKLCANPGRSGHSLSVACDER